MKPLSTKSYVKLLLYPACAFALLFWTLALWVEPVVGDLTRIGEWTENDFGWNSPQPSIEVRHNGRSVVDPEIVVLGDSFSITNNLWQSALSAQLGRTTLTFGYPYVGCVDNWLRWATGVATAKTVVVEVIERNFVGVFGKPESCAKSTPIPVEIAAGVSSSVRPKWPPTLDAKYLFHSAANSLRMRFSALREIDGSRVINAPIRAECGNFSNRRNDRLLYYIDDDKKKDWTRPDFERAVERVRQMKSEVEKSGKRFIFVVVPDKSSVYRSCIPGRNDRYFDSTRALIAAGIETPDLLTLFRSRVATTRDLYYPDNTHWSESGYLLMAGRMAEILGRAKPAD